MMGKRILSACAVGALLSTGAATAAVNFDTDVAAGIDKGLAWFDGRNCYQTPFSCGDATGLALLALLEKRPAADQAPQGYAGANADDQARMRRTIRYIINDINNDGTNFYAYRDGAQMMALSVYMRTGGPDKDDGPTTELDGAPLTLKQALDKAFDRTIANQRKGFAPGTGAYPEENGYWCYNNAGCRDSSTTQLVVAGLAAVRGVYNSGAYADAARLAQLNAATVLARTAYESNGVPGDYASYYNLPVGTYGCGALPGEKGHGYNADDPNSIQQTASGLWIQIVGGASLNSSGVQNYLRWLMHRYRYENINVNYFYAGWSSSYWYYLWSSFKAFQFLADSKVTPAAGNIGVADIGSLTSGAAPACTGRQVHRDPTALPRIAMFGADGPGYYGDEEPRIYFDYAYTILSFQCADGNFGCNGGPGRWNDYARSAYALLVLQRSVGGGCPDIDGDGICDQEDEEVDDDAEGSLYCDATQDGKLDMTDLKYFKALLYLRGSIGQNSPNYEKWADYDGNGFIDAKDAAKCILAIGNQTLKYY